MRPIPYLKRLVVLAFVIEVTSRHTPYGSRLINYLGNSIGGRAAVGCGNCDNRRHHNQKNIVGTGSDSSLVEISFQPLRELESVSSTSFNPLAVRQMLVEDPTQPTPPPAVLPSNLANAFSYSHKNHHRHRRSNHRPLEDDFQHNHRRYPDEVSNEELISTFTPFVNTLNGISYPEEEETEDPFDFMHRDLHNFIVDGSELSDEKMAPKLETTDANIGNMLKKISHHSNPHGPPIEGYSLTDPDASSKRNALVAFKRQKFRTHQTQFIPSISGGAMASLGDFFKNLKNNIEFMEKDKLNNHEETLLDGDHPLDMFREELNSDGSRPTGTAAFLHAIRTYRPSQRIRSLVALNPEGYHGSQFLDPNYMWIGLGKRK